MRFASLLSPSRRRLVGFGTALITALITALAGVGRAAAAADDPFEGDPLHSHVWPDLRREFLSGSAERVRWDERVFGREYDLDVFNVVAVSDFTYAIPPAPDPIEVVAVRVGAQPEFADAPGHQARVCDLAYPDRKIDPFGRGLGHRILGFGAVDGDDEDAVLDLGQQVVEAFVRRDDVKTRPQSALLLSETIAPLPEIPRLPLKPELAELPPIGVKLPVVEFSNWLPPCVAPTPIRPWPLRPTTAMLFGGA